MSGSTCKLQRWACMSGGIFDFLLFYFSTCPSERHGRACGAFLGVRVRELLMKVMTKVKDELS